MMRHRFHSICPYFAMFPEAFAEKWIAELTRPGEVVLDPFSGRGTTATCALLAGRAAVATDVNGVAYCLTRAKTSAPTKETIQGRLLELESSFKPGRWESTARQLPPFFRHAFHRDTLRQILHLRHRLAWQRRRSDVMIAALALGSLHGECDKSRSYFSNQMPRTISTKPAYSIRFWQERGQVAPRRDVFDILRERTEFRFQSERPTGTAVVAHRDMRALPFMTETFPGPIRAAITSPPYFDVTNFEEDQWLRLWFLGGPPYPTRHRQSRDDRHEFADRYWRFIADMWRVLGAVIQRRGLVVIRLGSSRIAPDELRRQLSATSAFSGRRVRLAHTEVSEIAKRQTDVFRPGSVGCKVEVDCCFEFER